MARYILKFGGTSVANVDRIKYIAALVKDYVDQGHEVGVVVSAMAGFTNQLDTYIQDIASHVKTDEAHVVLSAGEQVSAGLVAFALQNLGVQARSFMSWQVPIQTDKTLGACHIDTIEPQMIEACFHNRVVPIVAGFQGVSRDNRLTTLGRGGSDATAVALSHTFGADMCFIYTDVEGVYTADPRFVPAAKKLETVHYKQMYEMARAGAKVLQDYSVDLAIQSNIPVTVLSSFTKAEGTKLTWDTTISCQASVTAVVQNSKVSHVTLEGVKHLNVLEDSLSNHVTDMMTYDKGDQGYIVNFVINDQDVSHIQSLLRLMKADLDYRSISFDASVSKISLIGDHLMAEKDIYQKKINALLESQDIKHTLFVCQNHRISLLVDQKFEQRCVEILHHHMIVSAHTEKLKAA